MAKVWWANNPGLPPRLWAYIYQTDSPGLPFHLFQGVRPGLSTMLKLLLILAGTLPHWQHFGDEDIHPWLPPWICPYLQEIPDDPETYEWAYSLSSPIYPICSFNFLYTCAWSVCVGWMTETALFPWCLRILWSAFTHNFSSCHCIQSCLHHKLLCSVLSALFSWVVNSCRWHTGSMKEEKASIAAKIPPSLLPVNQVSLRSFLVSWSFFSTNILPLFLVRLA